MSTFPLPLLVADHILADLKRLNAQESGAYLRLLLVAQRSTRCTIPDDDAKLARWARVDLPTWRCIKPVVMAFWTQADGRWTHRRANKEREFVSLSADTVRRHGRQGERPSSSVTAECGRAADALSDALRSPSAAKPDELRVLARSHGALAITVLAAILTDHTAPLSARLTAAQTLLDRGFAKPNRETDQNAEAPREMTIRRIIVTPGESEVVTP